MAARKVVFGKCLGYWTSGYFVDIMCDGNHEGVCGSDNTQCSFKNLECGNTSKKYCRDIALNTANELNVPLETDWDS